MYGSFNSASGKGKAPAHDVQYDVNEPPMTRLNVPILRGVLPVCSLFLALTAGTTFGQNRSLLELYKDRARTVPRTSISRMSEEAKQFTEASQEPTLQVPLEGAVNDTTYLVGPNDQFTITVGGMEPTAAPSFVSSDGMLMLPGVGRVEAAGRSLLAVRKAALAKLKDSFRNVDVEIALTRPREFYVHVTGAVPEPGRYVAMPVARVEDVLKQAFFSPTLETPTDSPHHRPGLRNLVVTHIDGTSTSVDLVKYYRTGNVSWNPFLQDGDAIQVPAFDLSADAVFIDGEVPFPGAYDFRPGDTVLDLLEIGAGSTPLSDDRVVQLTRRDGEGDARSSTYSMRELRNGPPVAVMPLDHLHVPEPYPSEGLASVEGWVHFPGKYPITAGKTTLIELVSMAGGLREGALLRGAYLERDRDLIPEQRDVLSDLEAYERDRDFRAGGRWTILTDSSSSLWQMRLGNFDFMSRYYLARWLRMDNRVSADMAVALKPDARPIYLEPGDRLVIPRDEHAVFVIGEVSFPGRVAYQPGAAASDYVARAGGAGPKAAGTYVIRGGTGQVMSGTDRVFSGDYVFVDRKDGEPASLETEQLRIQMKDQGLRKYQTYLQTVGTVLSIVTTALLVENALNN